MIRTLIALLILAGNADAHGLGAEAKLKGGRVHVEGFFDDDTAADGARAWVEDGDGKKVAEGRTDTNGRWSFPAPAEGRYRVVVDAGAGHRATASLVIPAGVTPDETTTVTEGKTRKEFTRFPWERLTLGVAVIGLIAVGLGRLLKSRSPSP